MKRPTKVYRYHKQRLRGVRIVQRALLDRAFSTFEPRKEANDRG